MLTMIFDKIATTETVGYYGGLLIESTLQRDARDYGISLEERHVLQVTIQITINRLFLCIPSHLGLYLCRGLHGQVGLQPWGRQRPRAGAPHLRPPGHEPRSHQEVRALRHGQVPQSREDDIGHHRLSGVKRFDRKVIMILHGWHSSGSHKTHHLHPQGHSPHQQLPPGHLADHAGWRQGQWGKAFEKQQDAQIHIWELRQEIIFKPILAE